MNQDIVLGVKILIFNQLSTGKKKSVAGRMEA